MEWAYSIQTSQCLARHGHVNGNTHNPICLWHDYKQVYKGVKTTLCPHSLKTQKYFDNGCYDGHDCYTDKKRWLWWNISDWRRGDRREREEGQQARCAEVWPLCQTRKCGEYSAATLYQWPHVGINNLLMETVIWCLFQRKSWKRRFFTLDDNAVSYYKSEMVRSKTLVYAFWWMTSLSACVWIVLMCATRIRSLSELFHWGTFRRSMNVSSSQGELMWITESNSKHFVSFPSSHCNDYTQEFGH